ncbi:Maf family nucleotide pyrophosphatase [Lutimonas halocynthiae]|uniref:Maf family nucleotide pyrophosphatase n=1 Tax=Lutimonas halocynthiae TaxID=1446477 RepID=UPI0025B46A73|nr:Maf family nucleotide pyrophosphatase [Lutimonas halocynthiae]MDN3644148.1 Maf family nucleotide pyrophosphatase [Lutimonas halocynthiae]
MLQKLLKDRRLILASQSPRRSFFLKELNLEFEIRIKEVAENYPIHLQGKEISEYLAKLKASPFSGILKAQEILITADTIVWLEGKALGKPKNKKEAVEMLKSLSGKKHDVISSIALTTINNQIIISDTTQVIFKKLTEEEIHFYIETFKPFDKAGSYGIQEWIGYIGIEKINGSYFNVMGFPVQKFYTALHDI